MLKPHVFHGLCDMVSVPAIDLFASRINAQVATYVSWPLEPAALFINAFSIHWGDRISYAFSLFSLIARVLRTLQEDRASMVAFFASVAVTSLVPQGPSVTCSATSPPPLPPCVIPAEPGIHPTTGPVADVACDGIFGQFFDGLGLSRDVAQFCCTPGGGALSDIIIGRSVAMGVSLFPAGLCSVSTTFTFLSTTFQFTVRLHAW